MRGGKTYLLQLVTGYRRRIFIRGSLQTSGWGGAAKINTTTTTTTTSLRRAQLRRDEKKSEQRWADTNYSLEAHKGHQARCKQQGGASPRVCNEPGNRISRRSGDWGKRLLVERKQPRAAADGEVDRKWELPTFATGAVHSSLRQQQQRRQQRWRRTDSYTAEQQHTRQHSQQHSQQIEVHAPSVPA